MSYLNLNNIKKNRIIFFLISSIARLIILYASIFIDEDYDYTQHKEEPEDDQTNEELLNLYEIIFVFSTLIKLGIIPLHFWVILTIKSISYPRIYLYFRFIKIIPIIIFYHNIELSTIVITILTTRRLTAPVFAYLRNSFKTIYTYSSIYHTSLLILIIYIDNESWIIYLIAYIISTYGLFYFLSKYDLDSKLDLIENIHITKDEKNLLTILIISYCQFPPISTFSIKITFTESLTRFIDFRASGTIFVLTSTAITYVYLDRFNQIFTPNKTAKHTIYIKKKFYKDKIFICYLLLIFSFYIFIPLL